MAGRRAWLCTALWPAIAPAQPALDWQGPFTLALLARHLAAIPERRARFTEERRFAALDQVLRSEGTLFWRQPDLLEKRTERPEPELLRVAGNRVEMTTPGRAPVTLDLAAQPALRVFVDALRAPLAGDLALLERGFEPMLSGGPAAWTLRLVPRGRQMLAAIEISGSLAEPREIRLLSGNGDEQRLLIEPLP